MGKKALITGISGQTGSYLAEHLLSLGYEVHGIKRRSSSLNTQRIDHIFDQITLHYGDMTDATSLVNILSMVKPDEVYNLAAQSHVKVSFEVPEYTADATALGCLRLLEAVLMMRGTHSPRVYQASTSELFGDSPPPQNEATPFRPRSPYAAAKLYGYWIVRQYREAYGLHVSNGIMFNHESPRRGETFVTRKIARAVARREPLVLGNLDAVRDWGHARDYARAMHLMLQQDEPDDYVIATGEGHTVREFVEEALSNVPWPVKGTTDPRYMRPLEVTALIGDASKARGKLGWAPTVTFRELVREMVEAELP